MKLSVDITTNCDWTSLLRCERISDVRFLQYIPQAARLIHPVALREPSYPSQYVMLLPLENHSISSIDIRESSYLFAKSLYICF